MDGAVKANDPVTSLRYHKNQYGHPNHSGNGLHLMMKDHIDELLELVKKDGTLYQMILDFEKFLEANLLPFVAKFERTKKLTTPPPGRYNRCKEISAKAQVEEINEQPCTDSFIDLRMEKKNRTEKLELPQHTVSLKRFDSNAAISDSTICVDESSSTTVDSKKREVHGLKNESNHNTGQTNLEYQSNVRHGRKFVEGRHCLKTFLKFSKILFLFIMFSLAVERCSGLVERTVAVGMHASIFCNINAKPNLRTSSVENGTLDIQRVRWKDAGAYDCGEYLEVTALVPFFQQTPLSYIQLRPEKYRHLVIEMSFQPHLNDGLILYIGNDIDESPVVTFGLQGAQPVMYIFKENVPNAIKGKQLVSLNKWHTLSLKVNRKTATMVLDKFPPFVRTIVNDIDFSGCNIYIGALPNSRVPLNLSGFSGEFVGYISQFKHNNRLVDLGSEAFDLVGINHYNACAENPCRNCIPANVKEGFALTAQETIRIPIVRLRKRSVLTLTFLVMPANVEVNVLIKWKTTDKHITYVKIDDEDIASCTPLLETASLEPNIDFELYNVSYSNDICQLIINYPVLNKAFGDNKIEIESSTAGLENVFVNESNAICMTSSAAIVFISVEHGYAPKSSFSSETQLRYNSSVIGVIVAVLLLLAAGILIMFILRGKIRSCIAKCRERHDDIAEVREQSDMDDHNADAPLMLRVINRESSSTTSGKYFANGLDSRDALDDNVSNDETTRGTDDNNDNDNSEPDEEGSNDQLVSSDVVVFTL